MAPQARFASRAHAKRYERERLRIEAEIRADQHAVREPRPVTRLCECDRRATYRDPEGELVCIVCAKPLAIPAARVNGYDAKLRELRFVMESRGGIAQEGRTERRRPRIAPAAEPVPTHPRQCAGCGAHLRRGRRGRLCGACLMGVA